MKTKIKKLKDLTIGNITPKMFNSVISELNEVVQPDPPLKSKTTKEKTIEEIKDINDLIDENDELSITTVRILRIIGCDFPELAIELRRRPTDDSMKEEIEKGQNIGFVESPSFSSPRSQRKNQLKYHGNQFYRRNGVIATIVEVMREATPESPLTVDQVADRLKSRFPSKNKESMMKTIRSQFHRRLEDQRGIIVIKDKATKGYYLQKN